MNIMKEMGEAACLEQLAEEAVELAQAALKMARIRRSESPTETSESEARGALREEIADVLTCIDVIREGDMVPLKDIGDTCLRKRERWELRLRAAQSIKINGKDVMPG